MQDTPLMIRLDGRIDADNASEVKERIEQEAGKVSVGKVVLDMEDVTYVSSAGLRVFLQLSRVFSSLSLIHVSRDVYDVLEMTGFTEILDVERALRHVSSEGCEVIGKGANGTIYRLDREHVMKTYKDAGALEEIRQEREMARLALVLGVPTAISYDVVRTEDGYGTVFELLEAKTFAQILADEPEREDWCVDEYTDMLRKIHCIEAPAGKLPHIKDTALGWIRGIEGILPPAPYDKLLRMTEDVPDRERLIHGDYHTKNIVLAGDEVMLIDMGTLSSGHPIFELAQMYDTYIGFGEYDPDVVRKYLGCAPQDAARFWEKSLRRYLRDPEEDRVSDIEDRIRCIAYARLIDWSRRHRGTDSAEAAQERELWTGRLTELLERVDTLDITLPAAET